MIEIEKFDLSNLEAISLSLIGIILGWVLYNYICKKTVKKNNIMLSIFILLVFTFFSWLYFQVFSHRGAYMQIGSMLGTIMVANVLMIIIPGQKKVVQSLLENKKPDSIHGITAKQRSLHNNYLTLPVIFFMLSSHYPLAFASELNWAIAPLVFLLGVSIRHYFNTYHATKKKLYWTWIITFIIFAVIIGLSSYKKNSLSLSENVIDLERIYNLEITDLNNEVHDIISARCTMCHAREPLWDGFLHPPKGFVVENKEDIKRYARQVYVQSAISKAMPPNNISYMEEIERFTIQYWYENKNKDD